MSLAPITAPDTPAMLHGLFAAATHEASAAMCRWTGGLITLALDEVRAAPVERVCEELGIGDESLTMVVLQMTGEFGGDMILAFDDVNGRRLAASLLSREVENSPEWTELEQSALNETGNILSCAYLNAVTRLVGIDLIPSPPYFVQDYAAGVLAQVLMPHALSGDDVLVCRTRFLREAEQLSWHVFFVPNTALRRRMSEALHSARA
jgi:chemotaxis protein CheC